MTFLYALYINIATLYQFLRKSCFVEKIITFD